MELAFATLVDDAERATAVFVARHDDERGLDIPRVDAREAARLESSRGALVAEIVPGSPAAAAGLKPGDVIVAFQNEPIQSPHDLTRRVAATPPGSKVTLRMVRGGSATAVEATLGRLKDTTAAAPGAER